MGPTITISGSNPSVSLGGTSQSISEFWDSGLYWDRGGFWDVGTSVGLPNVSVRNENPTVNVSINFIDISVSQTKPSGTV